MCCHWRERQRGRRGRERIVVYIILLCSLYYFIGLYVKKKKKNEMLSVLLNELIKLIK